MADFISGYNIVKKLGDGARSQVYEVVDPESKEIFTLKRVIRAEHEDARFLQQAIAEYEVSQKVKHESLRQVFELKRIRKWMKLTEVHLVMEYINGVGLDKLRLGSIVATIDCFIRVAEGLHAMHEAGYLHLDIKPNNIMITRNGQEKIIDLGQSCLIGSRKPRIQGTPDYIAPEQVERRHLSRQTDVFNLGATLYWALTGKAYPTMIAKSGKRIDSKYLRQKRVPSPEELNPKVPTALSRLVMESCAYASHERPQDMRQVIKRLELARGAAILQTQSGSQNGPTSRTILPAPIDLEDGFSAIPESTDSYDYSAFGELLDECRSETEKPEDDDS